MKRMARLMLHCSEQMEKENLIWNTVGSFLYALANMVLAFLVIRLAGEDAGGVFAIGFSTFGQQMFTVSYYGLRPFHITDSGADNPLENITATGRSRQRRRCFWLRCMPSGAWAEAFTSRKRRRQFSCWPDIRLLTVLQMYMNRNSSARAVFI